GDRPRRSTTTAASPLVASSRNGQPTTSGDGRSAAPLVRTIRIQPARPAMYIAATTAIGTAASTTCPTRVPAFRSVRETASTHNASTGGPISTGQVRTAATPAMANRPIAPIDGRSSHATIAHHIATAKSSDTTCEKNESCANEPTKNARARNSTSTEDAAIGARG